MAVGANAERYNAFDRMPYVCFHYEREHTGDPDVECAEGGCPAAGASSASALMQTSDVKLVQAANTVLPAILALEASGYEVTQAADMFVGRGAKRVLRRRILLPCSVW